MIVGANLFHATWDVAIKWTLRQRNETTIHESATFSQHLIQATNNSLKVFEEEMREYKQQNNNQNNDMN